MRNVIVRRLSALIDERNISERQLSLKLGYSPSYVNKIVNGQINSKRQIPRLYERVKICHTTEKPKKLYSI